MIPDTWGTIIYKKDGEKKKIVCYGINTLDLVREGNRELKKLKENLRIFQENAADVTLLLILNKPMGAVRFDNAKVQKNFQILIQRFKNSGFGIYDDTCNFGRALALCDAYYGDWCKVTWYFRKQGKPVMIQNLEV